MTLLNSFAQCAPLGRGEDETLSRWSAPPALLLAAVLAAWAFLGCGQQQGSPASAAPEDLETEETLGEAAPRRVLAVTDSAGREVEVSVPVERAVVLTGRAAEVIRAIGAAERIVGINSNMKGRDAAFWPRLSQLPAVGSAFEPNVEAVVQLQPDLVVAYAMRPGPSFNDQMAKFGIPVLRLDCYWPEEIPQDARLLGRLFAAQEGAEKLAAFLDEKGRVVEERIADVPSGERPKVYMEGYGEFRGTGLGTAGHEMCLLAGGRNIVEGLKTRNPVVSSEWVLQQNPRAIVKAVSAAAGGYGVEDASEMRAYRDEIMERTGWRHLDAVREGRVFVVSSDVWLGPAHVAARAQLAKWFYPERFEDVDPKGILVEYLKEFHGMEDPGVPFYPR